MTVHITFAADEEAKLREKAAAVGMDVESYIRLAALEGIGSTQTFDEMLAPIRNAVRQRGVTEDQLDEMIERARNEAWRERHKGQQ